MLVVAAPGSGNDPRAARPTAGRAGHAALGLALALLALVACDRPVGPSAPRRNLLLVTLDTTRADSLSMTGGPDGATPVLDALGERSVVFERATSESNVTNPSHLSILTGIGALRHGVLSNFSRMPEGLDTLPRAFARSGHATAAFVSARPLGRAFGWRGFGVMPEVDGVLDAEEVTDRALAWLGAPRTEPFFAWVHYWNPHTMYEPPDDVFERFYRGDPTDYDGPRIADAPFFRRAKDFGVGRQLRSWLGDVRDPAWGRAKYQAEVHYTDREIGRLLAGLEAAGLADSTVVVVTADHGESLGEQGLYYAHVGLYEPALRVPLLIHVPRGRAARSAIPVSTLDVAPTVAALFGLDLAHEPEGRSLASVLDGQPDEALRTRTRFVHTHASNRAVAIREGRWKLIVPIARDDHVLRGEVELFDLQADPGESRNLADAEPERVARMREAVAPWLARGPVRAGKGPGVPPAVAPDVRRQLEALGYSE